MRKRRQIASDIEEVKEAMTVTESRREFQKLQSVYLADNYPQLSAEEIGNIVNLSAYRVKMIHSNYRKHGMDSIKDKRCGRYRENMTLAEEIEFLAPFIEKGKSGALAVAGEIKRAYETKIGKKVAESTIYRLLDRHGFRKIAPYKRHKKANVEEQKVFKKTSSP